MNSAMIIISEAMARDLCRTLPVADNYPEWATRWGPANLSEYLSEVYGEPVQVGAITAP